MLALENFHMVLLILKIRICSLVDAEPCLMAKEGILEYNQHTMIRIPLSEAELLKGKPVVDDRYYIHYVDGIENCPYGPEFRFLGIDNDQFIFSSAPE